jgi:hypothetical protein
MSRTLPAAALLLALAALSRPDDRPAAAALEVGFGEADITPKVGPKERPVYLAGFGTGRTATGVNDRLMARAVVLAHGKDKVALVSVDLVGLFLGPARRVRKQLPGFRHVVVSSTHNHEGPDTLGLWGKTRLQSGVDADYLALVEKQIVAAVTRADKARKRVKATVGTTRAPELLADTRPPIVKHDELVVLRFEGAKGGENVGLVVQWNCHPETLGGKNTLLSADYVGYAVKHLRGAYKCPVVYLTGTVGGLMTSLHVPITSARGEKLKDGTFEKTARYGELLAEAAKKAVKAEKALKLTPIEARAREVALPLANKGFLTLRAYGVLDREAFLWEKGAAKGGPVKEIEKKKSYAIKTEVGYLRLGELEVACVPGEIYPELVLGKVPDPAPEGADFPDAPVEPAVYKQLKARHRMLIGLANDEVGYILPKRQWDEKAPYTYGLKSRPYGEINSPGPDTAPLLCEAFRRLVAGKK